MFAPVEVLSVHVVLFEPAESGLAFEAGDDGTNVDAEAFGYRSVNNEGAAVIGWRTSSGACIISPRTASRT